MKFTLKEARSFGWDGLKGLAYNSKENFENASAAYFEVIKRHGKVKTGCSDRIYFVLEGKGEFVINGEKVLVEKSDVIIVPKNTPYDYKTMGGTMKLFLVHCPAYDAEFEEKLE